MNVILNVLNKHEGTIWDIGVCHEPHYSRAEICSGQPSILSPYSALSKYIGCQHPHESVKTEFGRNHDYVICCIHIVSSFYRQVNLAV